MSFINTEYEQIVLGSLLLEPVILDNYNFYEDLFGVRNNKLIFKTIVECIETGVTPDIIVVSDKLKDSDIALSYVSGLTSIVPSASNIDFYRSQLEELSRKRKLDMMIKVCAADIKNKSSQEIIEHIENALTNLNDEKRKGYLQLREYTQKAIERIEKKYHKQHDGIRTGYRDADYLIEEIPPGTLTIIAARTSLGKTTTALNIAHNITRQNKKVGLFSCEMSGDLIAERFIQKIAMVNTRKVYNLTQDGFERMMSACEDIYLMPIWVDDTPNIYLYELKSKARKMKREGIDIIFIDYLGLIKYQNEKLSLYEKYGAISKELKQLARELDIPIVALHQLNREAEGCRPSLNQLRNSGQIEEDSDIIVLMSGNRKDENMELLFDVVKNRLGAAGDCRLIFKKEFQLITNMEYETNE